MLDARARRHDGRRGICLWRAAFVVALGASPGCEFTGSTPGGAGRELHRTNLRALGMEYGRYMQTHRGRAPESAGEFRKFLATAAPDAWARFGVSEVDQLFVSPRDGAAMIVLYGKQIGPAGTAGLPWIAHEPQSTNGYRYVVGAAGAIVEMDDAEFQETFPGSP